MIHEFVDMDTKEKIRYVSESSNTSGYSTSVIHGNTSPGSVFSMPPSPAHSPATTTLQAEFSNLNLPSNPQAHNFTQTAQQNVYGNYTLSFTNSTPTQQTTNMQHPQFQVHQQQQHHHLPQTFSNTSSANIFVLTEEPPYTAELRIIEQPVEKFRFRYKSEMHGTHGSLNGVNSKRTPKTYPEVELRNFHGRAIIRCSLFQTNLESPHSHQLVVRKEDNDICDPHELEVSPDSGYVAQFQNMGIIHTAKKFIVEELYIKKKARLCFELGREDLSTKEEFELRKQTEKEAKDMNLNQVRLCFEAFKIEDNNTYSRIAKPIYTHPINNRKSAQTGELRIVRLSMATGSVTGGDELILLVEKVSKKNIKVRFFEEDEEGAVVWEGFGKFRESDVHHQYAIVCQTPAYHNKDIDKVVDVNIELIRPSDDERSYPTVTFRYKPRDVIASRKRRRTCSTATSSSGSGSSLNSEELPKMVQNAFAAPDADGVTVDHLGETGTFSKTISQEFEKDKIIQSEELLKMVNTLNSEDWQKIITPSFSDFAELMDTTENSNLPVISALETDGVAGKSSSSAALKKSITLLDKLLLATTIPAGTAAAGSKKAADYLQRIFKIYDEIQRNNKKLTNTEFLSKAQTISELYIEYSEKNQNDGDSIIHDIIMNDNSKIGIKMCQILKHFELTDLLNRILNAKNESGLHYACLYERPLYIRPLLGLGCDPSIEDRQGNTALHVAVREQHTSCVDSFLNVVGLRLNLTQRNHDGETPLHIAIRLKNVYIIRKLLHHDSASSLVPRSKDGNNSIHMAVHQQSLELVEMILALASDKKALLASKNTAGFTAEDLAKLLHPKLGRKILTLLNGGKIEDDDADTGELVIKQEQTSDSSDTEDAEDVNDVDEVKTEINDDDGYDDVECKIKIASDNLVETLKDGSKLKKVASLLSEQSKWRALAKELRLNHLFVVIKTSEEFLTHVRSYPLRIDYDRFVRALAKIDGDAFELLVAE